MGHPPNLYPAWTGHRVPHLPSAQGVRASQGRDGRRPAPFPLVIETRTAYNVPDPPRLYRVTSSFQKIYIESSGYFIAYRSGDDVSFQSEGKGYLVKDLSVRWFYGTELEKRFSDEVYRKAFTNYHEVRSSAAPPHSAVDELFTYNQARNLAKYLASSFDDREAHHRIEHGDFPFEPDQAGISDVPVGGMRDLWILPEEDGYPLGFSAWGFYDLSRHEKTKGLTRN